MRAGEVTCLCTSENSGYISSWNMNAISLPNARASWEKVLILFCSFVNIALSFYKSDPSFYLLMRLTLYRYVKKKKLVSFLILLIQFLSLSHSYFIYQRLWTLRAYSSQDSFYLTPLPPTTIHNGYHNYHFQMKKRILHDSALCLQSHKINEQ